MAQPSCCVRFERILARSVTVNFSVRWHRRHKGTRGDGSPRVSDGLRSVEHGSKSYSCLGITVHDDPAKREAAMELARFLTSAEVSEGVKVWSRPARKSVIEAQQQDPEFLYADFMPQFEAYVSKLIPLMGQGPHSIEVITLYESQVEAIFSGDLTPEQALSEFEEKANQTLAE